MPDTFAVRKFVYAKPASPVLVLFGSLIAAVLLSIGLFHARGWAFLGCLFFLVIAVLGVVSALFNWGVKHPETLDLRPDGALLPKPGIKGGYIFPKYSDVQDIELAVYQPPNRRRGLRIDPPTIHTLTIKTRLGVGQVSSVRFLNLARFNDFAAELAARVQAARGVTSTPTPAPPPPASPPRIAVPVPAPTARPKGSLDEAILRRIREGKASDPLIGAKLAANEIYLRVTNALKDDRGVHGESLICALGAVAGRACQASVRAQAVASGKAPDAMFMAIDTKDGKRYYQGDALNKLLAENKLSVWSIAGGGAQQAGVKDLPDIIEMFSHNARVIGSPAFGVPRLPPEHPLRATPETFADGLWPLVRGPLTEMCDDPKLWPIAAALAVQKAIIGLKGVLDPRLALTIAMESAIPVSKMNIPGSAN